MTSNFHSVTLDKDKCIGCTDCIKRCPTEAIRVRNSKAVITDEKCIDCGVCIRVCRNNAKQATTDPFDKIFEYEYKVAIPTPTLYTQFKGVIDPNIILTGLKQIGFDDVFELAKAAERITEFTKQELQKNSFKYRPIISSACPAIVKLIQMRFPSLIPNIMPIISLKEAAARYAKSYLMKQGMKEKSIGVFFITPCAAKVTDIRAPETSDRSYLDGVISIKEIFLKLAPILKYISNPEPLRMSSSDEMGWAEKGSEGRAANMGNYIAVDGIENVIQVLERAEDGKLDVEFIECFACVNGCLGGPLTIENSFVAAHNMEKIKKFIRTDTNIRKIDYFDPEIDFTWDYPLNKKQVSLLDEDMSKAIEKIETMEKIYKSLPQIDCGSCGAPTCRALAGDIVRNVANIEDCIFMLRKKVRSMTEEMVTLERKMPPSISKNEFYKNK